MNDDVAERLISINRSFYDQFASEFAETRTRPQPGFQKLAVALPRSCRSLLDVGCGNGRLGRYLFDRSAIQAYAGVDSSQNLLDIARKSAPGDYWLRELSEEACLLDLGNYDVIACLATLQHIPGRSNRQRLLGEFVDHLEGEGLVLLSTWQFLDSDRQKRKLADWSQIGLSKANVETGDYLIRWQRGGHALRYVAYIDAGNLSQMALSAGLKVLSQFRSDGKEGNLNLYSILSV